MNLEAEVIRQQILEHHVKLLPRGVDRHFGFDVQPFQAEIARLRPPVSRNVVCHENEVQEIESRGEAPRVVVARSGDSRRPARWSSSIRGRSQSDGSDLKRRGWGYCLGA